MAPPSLLEVKSSLDEPKKSIIAEAPLLAENNIVGDPSVEYPRQSEDWHHARHKSPPGAG
jgi:hypothetical protein